MCLWVSFSFLFSFGFTTWSCTFRVVVFSVIFFSIVISPFFFSFSVCFVFTFDWMTNFSVFRVFTLFSAFLYIILVLTSLELFVYCIKLIFFCGFSRVYFLFFVRFPLWVSVKVPLKPEKTYHIKISTMSVYWFWVVYSWFSLPEKCSTKNTTSLTRLVIFSQFNHRGVCVLKWTAYRFCINHRILQKWFKIGHIVNWILSPVTICSRKIRKLFEN